MTIFKNETKWDTSNVVFKAGKIMIYNKNKITTDMNYIDYGLMLFNKEIMFLYKIFEVKSFSSIM